MVHRLQVRVPHAIVTSLMSSVSISFQRIEPMRYTAYVQECLRDLEQEMEYVTDGTLCFLVRIQRLTERIFELKEKPVDELPKIPTAPMSAQVAAFQGEIDRLRESMPAYMQNDCKSPTPSSCVS